MVTGQTEAEISNLEGDGMTRQVLTICILGLTLLACGACVAVAAGLLDNSDFSSAEGWTIPPGGQWEIANDDGHSGAACLRYRSAHAADIGGVIRDFDCQPNTDYVIAAWLKSDGKLVPSLQIIAPDNDKTVVASLSAASASIEWKMTAVKFNSGQSTRLRTAIGAGLEHLKSGKAPAGECCIDDVQVWAAADAPADLAVPGGLMRTAPGQNVALGKPYKLSPGPNYGFSADAGDATQLTDGVYSVGYFWVQKSTVGWSRGTVQISIDLGEPQPILGLSYNTAAGVAGVGWPAAIMVFVSDDGREWWTAGELTKLASSKGMPPAEGYGVHRYWTDELDTHGRYIQLVIAPGTQYTFCDEIEVFKGPDALLAQERAGIPTTNPMDSVVGMVVDAGVLNTTLQEIAQVREALDAANVDQAVTDDIARQLDAAATEARELSGLTPSFEAISPLSPTHEQVLAARARLWRAQGMPAYSIWQNNRWDPLKPADLPSENVAPPRINVAMMANEVRSEAINVTSAAEAPAEVFVHTSGLPGSPTPEYLSLRPVWWTGTGMGRIVASALPETDPRPEGYAFTAHPGLTQQAWVMVDSSAIDPGDYAGTLHLTVNGQRISDVPFTLHVSQVRMPDDVTLITGGWDYTNSPHRGITADNQQAVVEFFKRYKINGTWATSGALPFGKHDANGAMTEPPSTANFDQWVSLWGEGIKRYYVFVAFNTPVETDAQKRRIADWITFWADHMEELGLEKSQLALLLYDEPHDAKGDQLIISYANVISATEPEVILWQDPTWRDPREATPEMLRSVSLLCPNRPQWYNNRAAFEEVYLGLRDEGKKLSFYSCSGPVRALDPYSYHRLQAWDCFRYGGEESFFWALGDNSGASSWNEFAADGPGYAPQFLSDSGCDSSKHMEAIRESAFDYEYLRMLRNAVSAAEQAGRADQDLVKRAKALLTEGPERVLEAENVSAWGWYDDRDRSIADEVRVEVLAALEALAR